MAVGGLDGCFVMSGKVLAIVSLLALLAVGDASRDDPWEGDVDTVILDRSNFTRSVRRSCCAAMSASISFAPFLSLPSLASVHDGSLWSLQRQGQFQQKP